MLGGRGAQLDAQLVGVGALGGEAAGQVLGERAVERGEEIITNFPTSLKIMQDYTIYICGTTNGIQRFHEKFPTSRS